MITRVLTDKDKTQYESLIIHPVQTWDWGEFQKSQGHQIFRFGKFDQDKMISAYTVSFHQVPKTKFSIGTILRGPAVDDDMLKAIKKIAQEQNAVFVKFEPDVAKTDSNMQFQKLIISPKVAFYPYTFLIDLTQSEEKLLENMHSKTRYNIRVANRYGVEIKEETNDKGFEIYLKLLFDTTKRQGFYLHSQKYHHDLWKKLKDTGMVHIMLGSYQGKVITAFMLFQLKDKLFYPYGSSLDIHREVMAPTLLMWESIKLGQKWRCKTFDMWGCLGPDAKEGDNGFGFHRFKQGFNGQLFQYVGTYDFVINPNLYRLYNFIDKYRWALLHFKAKVLRK
jgi:lipid II:glycine glycyltransferase (peptidoglycan interpeptide bridge formation enzyme)